jgi:hypothetical protein
MQIAGETFEIITRMFFKGPRLSSMLKRKASMSAPSSL